MSTRQLIACGLAALALTAAGCGGDDDKSDGGSQDTAAQTDDGGSVDASAATAEKPKIAVPSGPPPKELEIEDLKVGDGAEAKQGDQVTVNYVGVGYGTKKEFDASYGRGPFDFPLGAGQVIPGWDEGVAGMKVGGRRKLTIPPDMAYGAAGSPPAIEPNETLIFVVDLVAVN